MGTMKETINKLRKETAKNAKLHEFDEILFLAGQRYRNSMDVSDSAEVYALKFTLGLMYEELKEQKDENALLRGEVNEMKTMLMKFMQRNNTEITIHQETVTKTTIANHGPTKPKREPKWNMEKIFHAFDMYKREHAIFRNLLPEEVKENWSMIYINPRHYTKSEQDPNGLTLKQLLAEYARTRSLY